MVSDADGHPVTALWCLEQSLTSAMAAHWESIARKRGATEDDVREAWRCWYRRQGESVVVIESSGGAA